MVSTVGEQVLLLVDVQDEDAGLPCDRHAHLVGHLEAPAPLEALLGDEDLDPVLVGLALRGVEARGELDVPREDDPPLRGERLLENVRVLPLRPPVHLCRFLASTSYIGGREATAAGPDAS